MDWLELNEESKAKNTISLHQCTHPIGHYLDWANYLTYCQRYFVMKPNDTYRTWMAATVRHRRPASPELCIDRPTETTDANVTSDNNNSEFGMSTY